MLNDDDAAARPALLPTLPQQQQQQQQPGPMAPPPPPFRYDLVVLALILAMTAALLYMAMRLVLRQQQQPPSAAAAPSPPPAATGAAVPAAAAPPTIVVKCDQAANEGQRVYVDYGLERDMQKTRAPLMFPQLVRGNEVEIDGGREQYDELYPVYDDDLALIGVDDAPTSAFAFAPSAHIHDTPMRENTDSTFVAVGGPASYDQGTTNAAVEPGPDEEADTVAAAVEGDTPAFDIFKRAATAGESAMEIGGSIVRPKSAADTAPVVTAPAVTAPAVIEPL